MAAEFDALDRTDGGAPAADYNVAPTKQVRGVASRHPRDADGRPDPDTTERSVRLMRWGLVPHWAKDISIGVKMINARAESAATKPAFRKLLTSRRCLLPADGWYEWRRDDGGKQPFFMTRPDGASIAFAGLWSTWHDPNAEQDAPPLVSCAVLTTAAVGQLTEIHHRMPLMLPARAWQRWLDPDLADVAELIEAPDPGLIEQLELRPVSTAVNNVRNNGPELLERVDSYGARPAEVDQQALFDPAPENTAPENTGPEKSTM